MTDRIGVWRSVRYTAAYAIIPNVVFALLGQTVSLRRPVVNLDYLLVGAVAPWLAGWLAVSLTAGAVLLDAAAALAPNYQLELPVLLAARGSIGELSLVRVTAIAAAAIAASGVLALAMRLAAGQVRGEGTRPRLALVGLALFLGAVDFVNGTNMYSASAVVRIPINVATSGTFKMARAAYVNATRPANQPLVPVASATGTVPSLGPTAGLPAARHVVLVIVESFGLFADTASNARLMAPFLRADVQGRYRVTVGTVKSAGATTSAEFRELCGVRANFRNAIAASRVMCLPRRLRAAGFRTVAIHGFTSELFLRDQWYPAVGFERMLFRPDLAPSPARQCGTLLHGVCDVDAARRVGDEPLAAPGDERRFVYWLTLNSHVPLDQASAAESSFDCRGDGSASQDEGVCLLMRVIYGVNDQLARLAVNTRLPPTLFVVVGDHEPSFLARRQRALFVPGGVPFVVLEPRVTSLERRHARHPDPRELRFRSKDLRHGHRRVHQ